MNNLKQRLAVLLFLIGLTILISLGVWQIQRGLAKSEHLTLLDARTEKQTLAALPAADMLHSLHYQSVKLAGQWQAQRFFLLANRIYQGQGGYEVLMPFQLDSGQWLLVNRGWIAQTEKAYLPDLLQDELPFGTLYQPDKGYTLGEAILPDALHSANWPKETLYLDMPLLSKALQRKLSSMMLILSPDAKNSFQTIWKPVVVSPSRHYAYAAQWFGLAIAFSVCGFLWYRGRPRKSP